MADINDITPSMDMLDLEDFMVTAEMAGGSLAVTATGRLIIYGVKEAGEAADRLNRKGSGTPFYVEALDETTLGFLT